MRKERSQREDPKPDPNHNNNTMKNTKKDTWVEVLEDETIPAVAAANDLELLKEIHDLYVDNQNEEELLQLMTENPFLVAMFIMKAQDGAQAVTVIHHVFKLKRSYYAVTGTDPSSERVIKIDANAFKRGTGKKTIETPSTDELLQIEARGDIDKTTKTAEDGIIPRRIAIFPPRVAAMLVGLEPEAQNCENYILETANEYRRWSSDEKKESNKNILSEIAGDNLKYLYLCARAEADGAGIPIPSTPESHWSKKIPSRSHAAFRRTRKHLHPHVRQQKRKRGRRQLHKLDSDQENGIQRHNRTDGALVAEHHEANLEHRQAGDGQSRTGHGTVHNGPVYNQDEVGQVDQQQEELLTDGTNEGGDDNPTQRTITRYARINQQR